jgi:hypothetical protein
LSCYLLTVEQIFFALGNNRPQVLVQLEDFVLRAIINISEGKSSEDVIDALSLQIQSLENDLDGNDEALTWFNLATVTIQTTSTPPSTEFPSTPLPGMSI